MNSKHTKLIKALVLSISDQKSFDFIVSYQINLYDIRSRDYNNLKYYENRTVGAFEKSMFILVSTPILKEGLNLNSDGT